MVAAVTNTSATTATSATSSVPGKVSAQEQTDRFMKLLVAQLNNQDPMNPMDNAQMTSQIAQINTVSGIQEVNDSIKSMASQFASMQMLQGSAMIGREVLTTGNTTPISNGVGRGTFDLAGNADKVTVRVTTPGGQLLDTVDLGARQAGRLNFEWDASKYSGSATPVFSVAATTGGKAVSTTPLGRDTVTAVGTDAGKLNLSLKSGAMLAYDAIKGIL